jgi:serine/threonine-protein kinase HipA
VILFGVRIGNNMSKPVEVNLWGTLIGYLGYSPGQTEFATFEYTDEFMRSGIFLSPVHMKYPPKQSFTFYDISKRTFKGLPGIFADSLPDKFGNQLIDIFMAQKNIRAEDITALDRLLYVGRRGMGALEYEPAEDGEEFDSSTILDLELLAELSELVLTRKEDLAEKLRNSTSHKDALNLIRIGSSAGGARAKALVARGNDNNFYDGTVDHGAEHTYWLLKFDISNNSDREVNRKDPPGMTRVEYIYGLIAKKCGINLPNIDFIEIGDDFHFMIERFDRVIVDNKVQKMHYASWAGIGHVDRDGSGTYSYEQLVQIIKDMKLGQKALTEIFRRAVFNIVGRNQDDHTKNFGFLMNKKGEWSLAPAFDMTYSYDPYGKWTKTHQIRLNLKQDGFTYDDIIEFAKYCNLTENAANKILKLTQNEFKTFGSYAKEYKVGHELAQTVVGNMRFFVK